MSTIEGIDPSRHGAVTGPGGSAQANPLADAVRALIAGEPVPEVLSTPAEPSPGALASSAAFARLAAASTRVAPPDAAPLLAAKFAPRAPLMPVAPRDSSPFEPASSRPVAFSAVAEPVLPAAPIIAAPLPAPPAMSAPMAMPESAASPRPGAKRMPTALYIVIHSMGRWWVDLEGKPYGPFETVEEARRGAIEIARVFGDENRRREVIVTRPGGGYEAVWTSDAAAA